MQIIVYLVGRDISNVLIVCLLIGDSKFAITVIIAAGIAMHPLLFSLLDGLIAVPIAISLTVFFILDSWYLMQSLSATECWAAAMQLHLDLVVPLKSLHHMCEISATD